ncbi:MAG: DUF4388 domain-containing protein [Cyanobacteria bacterium J06638_28]
MQLSGHLSELSWSNILRFLDRTQQTGCLTIELASSTAQAPRRKAQHLYFWVSQGYVLGATQRLSDRGLLSVIHQHGWLSYKAGERLAKTLPQGMPLGTYLKQQGALTTKQVHELFSRQVLTLSQKAASLQDATFAFETLATLPQMELTGLQVPLHEVQKYLMPQVA